MSDKYMMPENEISDKMWRIYSAAIQSYLSIFVHIRKVESIFGVELFDYYDATLTCLQVIIFGCLDLEKVLVPLTGMELKYEQDIARFENRKPNTMHYVYIRKNKEYDYDAVDDTLFGVMSDNARLIIDEEEELEDVSDQCAREFYNKIKEW